MFLFSCPGQEEARYGRPATGQTGRNLRVLLDALAGIARTVGALSERGLTPENLQRGRITIANTWPHPIWRRPEDARSEASKAEISMECNLKRLAELFGAHEVVVLCGRKAQSGFDTLQRSSHASQVLSIPVPHLGARGLNSIERGQGLSPAAKLKGLAQRIANQLASRAEPLPP
jgi:uracil-DNA glycosylase